MGNMLPLGTIAERAGINRDKVRYWASLLGVALVKVDGRLTVPEESAGLLEAMRKAIAAGTSPAVAAQEVKALLPLPALSAITTVQDDRRLDSIEGAVLTMAAQVGKLVEENRRLAGQVEALRAEMVRPALQIPVELPRPIRPWSPEPARDPAASMPWWKVAWLSLVAPEQLRRCDS